MSYCYVFFYCYLWFGKSEFSQLTNITVGFIILLICLRILHWVGVTLYSRGVYGGVKVQCTVVLWETGIHRANVKTTKQRNSPANAHTHTHTHTDEKYIFLAMRSLWSQITWQMYFPFRTPPSSCIAHLMCLFTFILFSSRFRNHSSCHFKVHQCLLWHAVEYFMH